MLAGVGGPANSDLRPDEYAGSFPDWFEQRQRSRGAAGAAAGADESSMALTTVDFALEQARRRREECAGAAASDSEASALRLRARELCEAIERGEIMRAFAKLDDETVDCPHPETGRYPAHCCVLRGSKELLQMMIEAQADLNRKDAGGQTALMAAAKVGNRELVKLLLDHGADAAEQDALGRTAAEMVAIAPSEQQPRVQDSRRADWREKLSADPAQLQIAAARSGSGSGSELRDLIDERERPKKYGAVLLTAIAQKDARTAESAVEAGGDVNAVDAKGDMPLLLLAKGKWKEQEAQQVKLALQMCRVGADVDARNTQGNAPLLYAAHRGSEALVEALLKLHADPTIANDEGSTALMYAAHGGHEAICALLLEAFSPVTATNRHGLTAAETAHRRGFKSCAVLIQAYEMAPKRAGDAGDGGIDKLKKKEKKQEKPAFDYSKWNALEKEMREDEDMEESIRVREQAKPKRPIPKFEDLGPEAFGLPADTPWPPADPLARRKGPFDYSRWDKIVDDIEKRDQVQERFDDLQQNPKYEYRDGQKLQVIF